MAFEVEVFVRALSGPPQVGDGEGKSGVAEGIGGRQVDFLIGGTFRRFITVEIGRSPRCQGEAGDAKSEGRWKLAPFDRTLSKDTNSEGPLAR